jgi:undecaprenyl-diphosphatase
MGRRHVATASAVGFAGLTVAVASGRLDAFDRRVGARLAVAEGSWRSRAAEVLSWLGPLPTTALAGFLLVPVGRKRERARMAVRVILGLGLGAAVHHAIKTLFPRARPAVERRRMEIPRSPGRSFPSGHTIYAILLARQVWALQPSPRMRAGALGWVVGMAGSRLALQAHWPSDVAGGALAGTALSGIVWGSHCRSRPRPHS